MTPHAKLWLAGALLTVAACSTPTARGTGHGVAAPSSRAAASPSGSPATTATTAPSTTEAPTTTTTTIPPLPPGWSALGRTVNGVPALAYIALPGRPGGTPTGVVRVNGAVTRAVLYAGSGEPGGAWPNQGAVPAALWPGLIAAFNSGFHTYASGGGWFDHGRTAVALQPGAASLVIRTDGSATVGLWGRDVSLTDDVVSVRQNLHLLVDGGANMSGAENWGATLGGVLYTWRSGIGVDAAGNLLYAGGPGLDAYSLGQVLIGAGAVRAMELDINPQWVSFAYYTGPGAGATLSPSMNYGPSHWLSGSARDFIAIFSR